MGPQRRPGGALRGGDDDDAAGLLGARRLRDLAPPATWTTSAPASAATRTSSRSARPTSTPALEWYFAQQFAAVGRRFLHGSRQLRRRSAPSARPTLRSASQLPGRRGRPVRPDACRSMRRDAVKGVELNWQQADQRELRLRRQLHLRGRQADVAGDERRRPAGRHVGEHLQPRRVLRERELQRARDVHLPLGVLQRPRPQHGVLQDDIGTLAASLGYKINDNYSVTLDGQNLNNPTLKYYARNEDQPRAFYENGRQYYLNLRVKF